QCDRRADPRADAVEDTAEPGTFTGPRRLVAAPAEQTAPPGAVLGRVGAVLAQRHRAAGAVVAVGAVGRRAPRTGRAEPRVRVRARGPHLRPVGDGPAGQHGRGLG